MTDQQVEYFIKSDLTWHKSTKSFGSSENFFNILWNNALEDKLNIFKSSSYKEFKKNNLNKDITTIIIAHRLSTVKKCDQIYLLKNGQLENQGTFEELIKVNKNFRANANN